MKNTYSQGAPLSGPRLDAGQVHAVAREGLEQPVQRARLGLAHGEDDAGQVVAARARGARRPARGSASCCRVGPRSRSATSEAASSAARHGSRSRRRPGSRAASSAAAAVLAVSMRSTPGQVAVEPARGTAPAACGCDATRRTSSSRPLCESRLMRDRAAPPRRRSARSRLDAARRASASRRPRWCSRPARTPWSAWPRSTAREDVGDASTTGTSSACAAERLARRQVREGALRPEVRDAQARLERARRGDDLAEDRRAAPRSGTAPGSRATSASTRSRSRAAR